MDRNRSGELLGRSAELMVVEEAIGDARAGVPSVLLVSGDAGIGKSALIEHAARRGDVTLILGHSAHIGGEVMPLAPVLDLLRQVRRSLAGDPAGVEAIIDLVGSGPGPLLSPLLELLGGSGGGAVKMIGVEDLQWADAATWDLFELVARNLLDEHIVWIGTYRENEPNVDVALRRRFAEFGRLPGVRRIHLGGLGRSDVSEQIATLVGEQASSTLVDGILTRGQGNPLFTEELVAAHLAGEDLPALLSSLFSADLTALPPATRSLLGIMATVGRNTGHEHLSSVADLDEQAVEAAMRPAIDARVVVVDPATDAFGFRHALIGEVVYAELLPSERKRLHRRVATALVERTSTGGLRADEAGEVAFHLDRSGDH
ncbi:MAG: AAA family ATPase, partial [Ilumatobacteraceae bacterium]